MKGERPTWRCRMSSEGLITTRDIAQAPPCPRWPWQGLRWRPGGGHSSCPPGPALHCRSPGPTRPTHEEFQVRVDWRDFNEWRVLSEVGIHGILFLYLSRFSSSGPRLTSPDWGRRSCCHLQAKGEIEPTVVRWPETGRGSVRGRLLELLSSLTFQYIIPKGTTISKRLDLASTHPLEVSLWFFFHYVDLEEDWYVFAQMQFSGVKQMFAPKHVIDPHRSVLVYDQCHVHDVTVISITVNSTLLVLLRVASVTLPVVIIWVTHSPMGYSIALSSAP